jgi:hypothetical protein
MPEIKENFYENILFKFESCSCDCVEDIEHITPGMEPKRTLNYRHIQIKKEYSDMPPKRA